MKQQRMTRLNEARKAIAGRALNFLSEQEISYLKNRGANFDQPTPCLISVIKNPSDLAEVETICEILKKVPDGSFIHIIITIK